MNRWHRAADVEQIWDISDSLRRGYWIAVVLDLTLGASLLIGTDARIGGSGFYFVRDTGGATVWGALFVAVAAALLTGQLASRQVLAWVLRGAGALFVLLTTSFLFSDLHSPIASLIGVPSYLAIAAFHFSQAEAYLRDRSI